ncbi:hypothetical protein X777_15248 [Ooceraea biroi]|uniref:Uncharacterized protein n=1 Tax=Ooceraea biroi TaxID=2015173 RepID=A0A026VVX1_OOCBI|nr:hypothetical protein X777_15248 [Ooceraea biroi]
MDKTKKALEKIIRSKIAAATSVRCAEKQAPTQYPIRTGSTREVVQFEYKSVVPSRRNDESDECRDVRDR